MSYHLNLEETGWSVATKVPVLPQGEIHVWRVPLRVNPERLKQLTDLLSEAELKRVARYRFPQDQSAYVAARGRLRELAGAYLGVLPAELTFEYAEFGKPYLAYPDFHFNVSHAGDWAVMAFSRSREIGVDVEGTDRSFRVEALVGRFFSRMEIPTLLAQPDRHRAFYLAWTRKEAVIKARGDGLSLPLDQFGVTIEEGESVRLLHTDWAEEDYLRWCLRSFTVAADYPAAVAWLGEGQKLRFLE